MERGCATNAIVTQVGAMGGHTMPTHGFLLQVSFDVGAAQPSMGQCVRICRDDERRLGETVTKHGKRGAT